MDSKDALEVYKACLQHTLKLIISFISFFSILCLLFGYYIYKSYDVVPATITATQGTRASTKAQKQSIKIQPGDSQNGRGKKSRH